MAISSIYSQRLRITGMASGLDTESIVNSLMQIEQMKVDKLKQEKQLLEWKRDDYREITNLLRGFYDKYFDILYAETNMLSSNAYNTYVAKSSKEEYLTVTASADAVRKDYQITSIKTATAAKVESSEAVSKGIMGTLKEETRVNEENGETSSGFFLEGKSVVITVDGVTRMIKFEKDYTGNEAETDLKNDFQGLLNKAFGSNRITVNGNAREITLTSTNNTSAITIGGGDASDQLGFKVGQSNRINLDSTLLGLKNQFGIELKFYQENNEEKIKFKINDKEFTFSGNNTLRQVISEINASDAGVTLSYSSISDTFRLENKATGASQGLTFNDENGTNFLATLNLSLSGVEVGTDAELTIKDGGTEYTIIRSTNTFTIDGVTYNLKKDFNAVDNNGNIEMTITQDVEKAFNNIKNFVEKYNELIDKINKELKEERYSGYSPLTDAQKEEMSEKQIEQWEEKARSGLLRNDSTLQKIVYSLRRALADGIEGMSISLSSIGITTGNYTEQGKLYIDENKLRKALQTKGDQVMKLFSQKSDISYSPDLTAEERTKRYNESGLMQRISDILQDNIRTIRDKDGRKGILLEKAGIVGDASEYKNVLYDQLKDINKRIDDALERMYRKEEQYWKKYTALETAMQELYSQSSWLSMQLGGGSSY